MKSFSKYDSGINISGYWNFFFIEDNRVKAIPQHIDGVVNLDLIEYSDPEDKDWYSGYGIIKTLQLGQEQKITSNGPSYPVKFEGTTPKKTAHNLALFHHKSFQRFILILNDRNGGSVILGEPGNGLFFSFKDSSAGYIFTYSGAYKQPSWFATGQISVDGTAYGAPYLPVTSVIMGADGKSAYEIAVENGFIGTESQWLTSLQGNDGDDGASAYQVAVANGFVGTQSQWLASLKGNDSSLTYFGFYPGL